MADGSKGVPFEKREYPRVEASCPIRYQTDDANVWEDATLLDYSATGIRMLCDDLLLKGTKLKLEVLPGSLQHIPQISVEGVVVRFSMDEECSFQIGCEFVSVVRSLVQNVKAKDYPASI
jgi:c-di-GMP-binding flagellar brake protein YcgR